MGLPGSSDEEIKDVPGSICLQMDASACSTELNDRPANFLRRRLIHNDLNKDIQIQF